MLDVDRKKNYQLFFDFSCDAIAFLFLFLHFDYVEAEVRGIQRFLWMIKQTPEVGYHDK